MKGKPLRHNEQNHESQHIAVIGLAGRFPGARNSAQLWDNLWAGRESVTQFTREELASAGVPAQLLDNPNYVRAGVLLEGIEYFDAQFFGLTPREAELIDPQQRILLECVWEALEDAGWDPDGHARHVSVFAGGGLNNYFVRNLASHPALVASWSELQKSLILEKDYLATRVSHKLNLTGPSMTVQTACSTSLVAVHLACRSLVCGESDMAVAGGVSVRIPQTAGYLHEQGSPASADGHCRAFDAGATGMILGSGAGVVVLKRLKEALEDGDNVRAVILGSSVNNDGSGKMGYTAPSVHGQAEVIQEALAIAGLSADHISYVEAHGTGTHIGDPIEVAGLTQAYRASTDRNGYCAIGSIKSNIGHLDAAAGVAGLIKTVLCLENAKLPASINYSAPNPNIDFENSPFYVQTDSADWSPVTGRRVAGVSSFGIGGTNAHVIVAESPALRSGKNAQPWHLIPISAKTPESLERLTRAVSDHLKSDPSLNVADVAFTLQRGRRAFPFRRAVAVSSSDDAARVLKAGDADRIVDGEAAGAPLATAVFMFPGQGAQYVGMARGLYDQEPEFRRVVDHCCSLLREPLGLDLLSVLYPRDDEVATAEEQLTKTSLTQPALFVVEYATARLWMKWGVKPHAMIGHSIGEYVAACVSGVFSLDDALMVVAERGRLMNAMEPGSMLAVRSEPDELASVLPADVALAVVNAPNMCVVAGPSASISLLERQLSAGKMSHMRLRTSHAFHSSMMEPALAPFQQLLSRIRLEPPTIPFVSNVTGTWIDASDATSPQYWARHLRSTVRFSDGLATLCAACSFFVEVGPGRTLTNFLRQFSRVSGNASGYTSYGRTDDARSDLPAMLTTLGRLWCAGLRPDWEGICPADERRRVSLPTYPFERQRYWVEAARPQKMNTAVEEAGDDAASGTHRDERPPRLHHDRPKRLSGFAEPQSELEKRIASQWEELLGFRPIGRNDNYFELGGDSLVATKVVSFARDELGAKISLKAFFHTPTVAELARLVVDSRNDDSSEPAAEDLQRKVNMI